MSGAIGSDIKYSFVKIKVLKATPLFWYHHLVGQTFEVQKRVIDGHISYVNTDPKKLAPPASGHFSNDDVEEVE